MIEIVIVSSKREQHTKVVSFHHQYYSQTLLIDINLDTSLQNPSTKVWLKYTRKMSNNKNCRHMNWTVTTDTELG